MAVDERLLREAAAGDVLPVLRFYTWEPAAVSLGRHQDEGTAVDRHACRERGIEVVRRITGGLAVLHHQELTYSIVSRCSNRLFPNDVIGTYKVIAQGLLAGLGRLGVPAEMASGAMRRLAPEDRIAKDPACFATPSHYELLVHGRKIVGSAQRRLPHAFLQHGSILMGYDPALESAVIPGGSRQNAVTSLQEEMGRTLSLDEVKRAFLTGFSEAFGVSI